MKPGAGDDLLSDDEDHDEEGGQQEVVEDNDHILETDESTDESAEPPETGDSDGSSSAFKLPWIHRRDTVKSDRPEIIQMHVREETVDGENGLQDDVEDILGEDVYALDVREAAYLVAMQHPEEVANQLREWGYDFK